MATKKKTSKKKASQKKNTKKKAKTKKSNAKKSPGLWANIHAKHKRIDAGSGEKMRKKGAKGAPTEESIRKSGAKPKSK